MVYNGPVPALLLLFLPLACPPPVGVLVGDRTRVEPRPDPTAGVLFRNRSFLDEVRVGGVPHVLVGVRFDGLVVSLIDLCAGAVASVGILFALSALAAGCEEGCLDLVDDVVVGILADTVLPRRSLLRVGEWPVTASVELPVEDTERRG